MTELAELARAVAELAAAERQVAVLRRRRRLAARALVAERGWTVARLTRELNAHLERPVSHDTVRRMILP